MKIQLVNELCAHFQWNPDEKDEKGEINLEPTVKINRPKINHVFKRHFKGTGHEKEFENASGDTLYNTIKFIPYNNLMLYVGDHATVEELIALVKEGKNELKQYGFLHPDDFMAYTEKAIDVQRALYKAFSSGAHKYDMSEVEWVIPDSDIVEAVNKLFDSKTKLPPLEVIIDFAGNHGQKVREAALEARDACNKAEGLEIDIEHLQNELRRMTAKSMATSAITIELDADEATEVPAGKTVTKKASEVFDCDLKVDFDVTCMEWEGTHPFVPKIDENYIFRPELVARILYAIVTNQRAYLQGHTGSGKTTLIEQVAARLGFPFFRVNFDSEVTRMDLIGRDTLTTDGEGNTVSKFIDGVLPMAMSSPCFFCCDEIDFVRPDVAYVMQAALEGNGLRISEDGGRIVKPHPLFRMFATGNTVGQGDEMGMYQGARPQSLAFLDRFTIWMRVEYMDREQRENLVKHHFPTLVAADRKVLSSYMEEHLEAFTTGKVLQPISPRGMLAVAKATVMFGDIREAFNMTILDRASSDDRSTLAGLVDRVCR